MAPTLSQVPPGCTGYQGNLEGGDTQDEGDVQPGNDLDAHGLPKEIPDGKPSMTRDPEPVLSVLSLLGIILPPSLQSVQRAHGSQGLLSIS